MEYGAAVEEMRKEISEPGKFGFEEFKDQVEELGNPQKDLDTIHVAGTNGKGSTCNIIYQILREEGYSVGLFTGPHLHELVERFKVDGEKISREEIGDIYGELRDRNFSMFESMVIIALKHFIREEVDIAIFETGCGGRRDATNIIEPEVSVITNVGMDHSHILGDTEEEIAREKAGIIKQSTPTVTNAEGPAFNEIRNIAESNSSELSKPKKRVRKIGARPLRVEFNGEEINCSLGAIYQVKNINTALEAIERSENLEVSENSVIKALEEMQIPGRMEKVSEDPEIIVDGAHNLQGVKALKDSIGEFETVVFGCMSKKPYKEMIEELRPKTNNFIFTKPEKDHTWKPEGEISGKIIEDPEKAIEASEGRTLVTGSLYLIGEIREALQD